MAHPVGVLRTLRGMLVDGACVLVADERTAERFSPDAGDSKRLHYGFSVLHCLPVGMVGDNAVATGTVMRPETLRRYATDAGFTHFELQPIEDKFWRLRPVGGVAAATATWSKIPRPPGERDLALGGSGTQPVL